MLEREVESSLVSDVNNAGGKALKWSSPGLSGVPDRIVLMPIPEHHRELVAKYVKFVELKAPGEKPRPLQDRVCGWIRDMGFSVQVVDKKRSKL